MLQIGTICGEFQGFMAKALPASILAATAIFGGLLMQVNPAGAVVVVTVDGKQWEISSFTGSYDGDPLKFDVPQANGVMPWWNSVTLASTFSAAYRSTAGSDGRFFAVTVASSFDPVLQQFVDTVSSFGVGGISPASGSAQQLYATASLVSSPPPSSVPGPLPILGAAAAFRASRRLKHRIQGSPSQV